jgi:pseudouridine-5'-phosphate glycosidase/sugar/nucleoside kinase (ribokinase family)
MTSKDSWGATTVASTAYLANRNNITTFVTGGIGGVHRGNDLDISADLIELSRTPIVVVSAGIKSLLDIPRTLEYLETFGVPVITYGTDYLPAFFSSNSPKDMIKSPYRVETPQDVAQLYWSARQLGLPCGMLVAVPNPMPVSHGNSGNNNAAMCVEDAIQDALSEAASLGIIGKDVTPYVLQAVAKKTGGSSLVSNIALIRHNASVGADVAIAIAAEAVRNSAQSTFYTISGSSSSSSSNVSKIMTTSDKIMKKSDVIVMGGAVIDIVAKPSEEFILGTSNKGTSIQCDGGVARNIAEVLGKLGDRPLFFSAVGGNDEIGKSMIKRLVEDCGVQAVITGENSPKSSNGTATEETSIAIVEGARTATYVALLSQQNELHAAIATDMDIFGNIPIPNLEQIKHSKLLVLDANPPVATLLKAAELASSKGVCIILEPTSVPKAEKVAKHIEFLKHISYATPNIDELRVMASVLETKVDKNLHNLTIDHKEEEDEEVARLLESVQGACSIVLSHMNWKARPSGAHLIVTLGKHGVLHASIKGGTSGEYPSAFIECDQHLESIFRHHFVPKKVTVENCTGAGDTFCGAFIHALLQGKTESDAIDVGMNAALKSLQCENQTISPNLLDETDFF